MLLLLRTVEDMLLRTVEDIKYLTIFQPPKLPIICFI